MQFIFSLNSTLECDEISLRDFFFCEAHLKFLFFYFILAFVGERENSICCFGVATLQKFFSLRWSAKLMKWFYWVSIFLEFIFYGNWTFCVSLEWMGVDMKFLLRNVVIEKMVGNFSIEIEFVWCSKGWKFY